MQMIPSAIPNGVAQRDALADIHVHHFGAVELAIGVRINGKIGGCVAGHLFAEDQSLVVQQVHAVFMIGILDTAMEIRNGKNQLLPVKLAFATHLGVTDAHTNPHRSADHITFPQMGDEGCVGAFFGVDAGQSGVGGASVVIVAPRCPNLLIQSQQIQPKLVVCLGMSVAHVSVEDLQPRFLPEEVIQRIVGDHDLLGMRMDKESVVGFDKVNQLTKTLGGEFGILKASRNATREFIFGECIQ